MSRYSLYAIRVFTLHWPEALAFYRDVVEFPVVFADADMGWAQFQLGGAYIGLEHLDPGDPEAADLVGRFVGVSIEVEDIQTQYTALCNKGVDFVQAPQKQPWGGTLAHFKDVDGNILTLLGNAR